MPRELFVKLSVDPQLVGGVGRLPDILHAEFRRQELSQQGARNMLHLLPSSLEQAPCFLDRLTHLWRYEYGDAINTVGSRITGTHMYVPVQRLALVLRNAFETLEAAELRNYLRRSEDPQKHQDVLAEFAPVLALHAGARAQAEVTQHGAGQTTIDWMFTLTDGANMLLEVKSRLFDLVQLFDGAYPKFSAGQEEVEAPKHDVGRIFASVEKKFKPNDPTSFLQGAWVQTYVAQESGELQIAFDELDDEKVHFVVLGGWEGRGYVLARNDRIKERVFEFLDIVETDRKVFERPSPGPEETPA